MAEKFWGKALGVGSEVLSCVAFFPVAVVAAANGAVAALSGKSFEDGVWEIAPPGNTAGCFESHLNKFVKETEGFGDRHHDTINGVLGKVASTAAASFASAAGADAAHHYTGTE